MYNLIGHTYQQALLYNKHRYPQKPTETDRKKRRKTTGDEKAILSQLSEYKEKLPKTAVREVLSKLSPDWTSERVKLYWSNNSRGKSN